MTTSHTKINLQTEKAYDFTDITEEILKFAEESGVKNGLLNVQIMHTSAGLVFNENEPLLLEDIWKNLEKTAPVDEKYKHDDFTVRTVNMCDDECENGHSHCKAIRLPSTITLNVIEGKVQLGKWQRIMFLELDRPRERSCQLFIIGE